MRAGSIAAMLLLASCTSAKAPMQKVLFVCPYGGAKSVIAASYFNRAAERAGLPYVADAVAAETPYEAVPPPVADMLRSEGFDVASFKPRNAAPPELDGAAKVIAIDCDVNARGVERWDDVPKVSVDLPASAAAIRRHVEALVAQLKEAR